MFTFSPFLASSFGLRWAVRVQTCGGGLPPEEWTEDQPCSCVSPGLRSGSPGGEPSFSRAHDCSVPGARTIQIRVDTAGSRDGREVGPTEATRGLCDIRVHDCLPLALLGLLVSLHVIIWGSFFPFFYFFFKVNSFIFGCAGSLLLHVDFLYLQRGEAALTMGAPLVAPLEQGSSM